MHLSDLLSDEAVQPNESSPQVDLNAKDHWKKGNSMFEASKFDDAIKEFDEAISIDPKYADAYFNKALTERIMRNYDAAKADLEKVMELQPSSPDAPLLFGDILESSNDLLGARFWYEKSLKIDAGYSEAKNRLEHLDSLIHMDYGSTQKEKQVSTNSPTSKNENTELIEEGQIKRVKFYKSNVKFDSVMGLEKVKKYLHDNVILAMQHPELFKKYGKKLGLGLILYGPP